jgi:hypothetical protein
MHSRNAGLQRLRSVTKRVGVAMTVLTGIFAGLAAAGNSGHHARRTTTPGPTPAPTRPKTTSTRAPAPPSLPPLAAQSSGGEGQSQQSQPVQPQPSPQPTPVAPPVETQAPPVVSSGGS